MTAEKNSIYFESFKNLFNEFYSLIDTDMKNCRYDIISVELYVHMKVSYAHRIN